MRLIFILFFISSASALKIDEKLTTRILKHTNSRKTILINRGLEDGLLEGDHAKFYLSFGVVARGVVIKASPTRTVWSLYRLVNADYIKGDAVVNLKITAPVKLTDDNTRAIIADDRPIGINADDPRSLGIPLAEGAEDLTETLNRLERDDVVVARLTDEIPNTIEDKNWEIWSNFHVTSLSATTTSDTGLDEYSSSNTFTSIMAGAEFYFKDDSKWYHRFSFYPFFNLTLNSSLSYRGDTTDSVVSEFGGGVSLAPFTSPHKTYTFIPFFNASLAVGTVADTFTEGSATSNTLEVTGSTFSLSLGGGLKYYLKNGFGFRTIIDYYLRTDSFDASDTVANSWERSNGGLRVLLGLGLRW